MPCVWRSIFFCWSVALAAAGPASANVFAGPDGRDPRVAVPREALSPVGVVGVVGVAGASGTIHRSGSGFMVGPCHMMTAHHAAGPQLRGGGDLRFFVAGSDEGYRLEMAAAGNGVVGSDGDWALLRVADCPGLKPQVGWMEVETRPWIQQLGRKVEAATLPFDAPVDRLTYEAGCSLRVGDPEKRLIASDCSATGGASGSPLYSRDAAGMPVVLAVVTAVANPTEGVLATWDIGHATLAVPVWEVLSGSPAALAFLVEDWLRSSNPVARAAPVVEGEANAANSH